MTPEEAFSTTQQAARQLGEHFEAVQILVTWTEDGLSHVVKAGAGNWYARQGMAHEFINSDVAQENARQIAEQLNPEE